jgi:hypothetical protein
MELEKNSKLYLSDNITMMSPEKEKFSLESNNHKNKPNK